MNSSRSVQRRASARLRTPLRREKLSAREMDAALGCLWFALVTPPQREKHCADALEKLGRAGLTVFTPLEWRYRRHSRYRPDQIRRVNVPAYPRYVFIGVPPEWGGLPWHMIQHITFVRGFLADPSGRPVTISSRDVAGIMKASQTPLFERADETGEAEQGEPLEVILPGEEIRVIAGLLSGQTFVASAVRDGMIEVEGQANAIIIPSSYVRRVA